MCSSVVKSTKRLELGRNEDVIYCQAIKLFLMIVFLDARIIGVNEFGGIWGHQSMTV
jgi:hypothetical protein